MPDELPENLEPDEIPGGPAVEAGSRVGEAVNRKIADKAGQAKDKLASKAGEEAGKYAAKKVAGKAAGQAVGTAAEVATAETGPLALAAKWAAQKFTEYVVNKLFSKDWWKLVLRAFWPQIAAGVVIVLFIVIAIALISRARLGLMGRSAAQGSSIYSDADMAYIDSVLNGDTYANLFQNITGTFKNPVGGDSNLISFNNTLHGKSVLHSGFIFRHNVYKGYGTPGIGDAVDLTIAQSSGSNKPVFAMYDGTVTTKADCAVLVSDPAKYNHTIESLYCHTHDIVTGNVVAGQEIAKIGKYKHVHFEVWVDNVSIHTTPRDVEKGTPYGKWLWLRIKKIFNV